LAGALTAGGEAERTACGVTGIEAAALADTGAGVGAGTGDGSGVVTGAVLGTRGVERAAGAAGVAGGEVGSGASGSPSHLWSTCSIYGEAKEVGMSNLL
jgi:hypothetical protein